MQVCVWLQGGRHSFWLAMAAIFTGALAPARFAHFCTNDLNGAANCEKVSCGDQGGRGLMKKVIAMAVLFIAAAGAAWGQDIVGDWQGVLPAGDGALRIVLHVTKADDGSLKAKLDSPDQNIVGMPVDSINLSGNKLKFNV